MRACETDADVVELEVAQRWLDHHGQAARTWLDAVPVLAARWAAEWDVSLCGPLAGGSVSSVFATEGGNGPSVLKLVAPWAGESVTEALALRAWDGIGAVRLQRTAANGQALLLERALPGTPATGLAPEQTAALLRELTRSPVPPGLSTLSDALRLRYARATENRHRLLSSSDLARARRAALDLALVATAESEETESSGGSFSLCHGDFLSKNILVSGERGLLAIDPNPFAGPIGFDAALWSLTEPPTASAFERGGRVAEALGLNASAVTQWIDALLAVEVCLAPLERAQASLELVHHRDLAWLSNQS